MRFHFVPLYIVWVIIKFEVFHEVFPSYRGLIWLSSGLGGAIFLKLKGNIMSDPPLFSTCSECLINFMGRLGSLKLLCQLRAIWSCANILFFCGSSLHTFDKIIKICKEHILIFNFALPFWEHYALPILISLCVFILGALLEHTHTHIIQTSVEIVPKNCRLWGSCTHRIQALVDNFAPNEQSTVTVTNTFTN